MKVPFKKKFALITIILLVSLCSSLFSQDGIKTSNTSAYIGNGKWSWKVFLAGPKASLTQINTVTYTLHKTFSPNRITVNKIGDANYPYAFSANGWGEFTILVEIRFKNGQTKNLSHQLKFVETPVQNQVSAGNISKEISRGWWSWTIYVSAPDAVLDKINCVEYTLDKSFPEPVQLICKKGNGKMSFPFSAKGWGEFAIKIKIIYNDGSIQNLRHNLVFGK